MFARGEAVGDGGRYAALPAGDKGDRRLKTIDEIQAELESCILVIKEMQEVILVQTAEIGKLRAELERRNEGEHPVDS